MDDRLRDAERRYIAAPTPENLERLNYIRNQVGLRTLEYGTCENCARDGLLVACDYCEASAECLACASVENCGEHIICDQCRLQCVVCGYGSFCPGYAVFCTNCGGAVCGDDKNCVNDELVCRNCAQSSTFYARY